MKHIKEIEIFEKRTYKNLAKFSNFIKKKFGAYKVIIFEEDGINNVFLEYGDVSGDKIRNILDFFKDCDIKLIAPNRYTPINRFEIINVPNSIFEQMDIEIEAKKYNI